MTALRRRRLEDRQRRGLAPRTPQCYGDAVKQLTQHYRRAPDQMREDERRQYCLFLINDQQVAERTCRLHLEGSRFFSEPTLKRPWPVFDRVRPRNIHQRPGVLSLREVRSLRALVEPPKARRCLPMRYACGRRRREGPPLRVSDLAAPRRLVRVRQGHGGQARLVPRAPRGLELWREDWPRQRPRPWVFPARDGSAPLSPTSLQPTCNAVGRQRGSPTEASSHTLRHA